MRDGCVYLKLYKNCTQLLILILTEWRLLQELKIFLSPILTGRIQTVWNPLQDSAHLCQPKSTAVLLANRLKSNSLTTQSAKRTFEWAQKMISVLANVRMRETRPITHQRANLLRFLIQQLICQSLVVAFALQASSHPRFFRHNKSWNKNLDPLNC